MKRLLYLLPLLVLASFTKLDTVKKSTNVRITPQSTLHIKGTSNVTDFTCLYNIKNLNEPIRIHYESDADVITFEKSVRVSTSNIES